MSKEATPAIGKGSPAGPRWFYSKHPELVLEVTPQRYPLPDGSTAPFMRVPFMKQLKPQVLQGIAYLGTKNATGSDINANQYYGVLAIEDPGQETKDKPFDEEQQRNRRIIDHIRKMDLYKKTAQTNKINVTARLLELNWDPRELGDGRNGFVIPGSHRPVSRPVTADAPEDAQPEIPATKTPQMGRQKQAA